MSRLKSKLDRRRGAPEDTAAPSGVEVRPTTERPSAEFLAELRKRIERTAGKAGRKERPVASDGRRPGELDAVPCGEVVETEAGPVLVASRSYGVSYRCGAVTASQYLETGAGLAALAGPGALEGFSPAGSLFLDTETTGLAGGTGTLPFLVGLGWFGADGGFNVEQLFCREPSQERAQLEILAARLARASNLVTFNGRAFDVPLLNTRFVMHKIKNPGYALYHLDLLAVARRVFKRRLRNCALSNLESAILGFERVGDIAGSAIPGIYASYLRGGSAHLLEAVFEHNALDLISLAALGARLDKLYLNPDEVEHAADHLGLAMAALKSGQAQTAENHLALASAAQDGEHSRDALELRAREAGKRGEYAQAKSFLLQAVELSPDDPHIRLHLAKHLEHREKDFSAALAHAAHTAEAEGVDRHRKRMTRLRRRLEQKD